MAQKQNINQRMVMKKILLCLVYLGLFPGISQADGSFRVNPLPILNGQTGLPIMVGETKPVAQVTGLGATSDTAKYNILGTDLGFMWDNGFGEMLTVYGDTISVGLPTLKIAASGSYASATSSGASNLTSSGASSPSAPNFNNSWKWRSNILLRSYTKDPSHGIFYHSASRDFFGQVKTLVDSPQIPGREISRIPTSGTSVAATKGVQYLFMMSVKRWGNIGGEWTTNFSNLAMSADDGEHWLDMPFTRRYPVGGNEKFQMLTFLQRSQENDGYVYLYGTPAGRGHNVYTARVPEKHIPQLNYYEYWNGKYWIRNNPAVATPLGPRGVGELSAKYNSYLKRYVMLTTDMFNNVVIRVAKKPQGPWSPPTVLISSVMVPTIYAPMQFPYETGEDLYYSVSTYNRYNVILMRTPLKAYKAKLGLG